MIKKVLFLITIAITLGACSSAVRFSSDLHPDYSIHNDAEVSAVMYGKASYYADKFEGRPTSSGEKFSNNGMTAAHKSLPFGTLVRVTNLENNKQVVVRINDRGPYVAGRVIDLSKSAAESIDMLRQGVVEVKIEGIKMKILIMIAIISLLSFSSAFAHELTVEIIGDEDTKGTYYVAMWDNEEDFLNNDKLKISENIDTKGGNVTIEIDGVSSGWWAIAVLLDENGNKDMDYNMFGAPTENFGFSNNPTVVLSEPEFRECKFYISSDTTINIEVD